MYDILLTLIGENISAVFTPATAVICLTVVLQCRICGRTAKSLFWKGIRFLKKRGRFVFICIKPKYKYIWAKISGLVVGNKDPIVAPVYWSPVKGLRQCRSCDLTAARGGCVTYRGIWFCFRCLFFDPGFGRRFLFFCFGDWAYIWWLISETAELLLVCVVLSEIFDGKLTDGLLMEELSLVKPVALLQLQQLISKAAASIK